MNDERNGGTIVHTFFHNSVEEKVKKKQTEEDGLASSSRDSLWTWMHLGRQMNKMSIKNRNPTSYVKFTKIKQI